MEDLDIRRIQIKTIDRVHMTADILKVFSAFNVNIIWMEVYTHVVYIKFEIVPKCVWDKMFTAILAIPGVQDMTDIDLIAFEEREQLIETILHSNMDGIIVVDKAEIIKLSNPVAAKILREPLLEGTSLSKVLPPLDLISRALSAGRDFSNHPLYYESHGAVCHFLISGTTVKNEAGTSQALILTLRDMQDVREIVHTITQSRQITFEDIITQSPVMLSLLKFARNIARNKSTVLIRGESGTGKELFARAIHSLGNKAQSPFIPLNCAAIPETLIESELFGYDEGSFTGGKKGGKQGLFELAHGGTLFLDEVGELSPYVQAKLLRALQESCVRRIGGQKEIPVDVRIITATNRDLEDLVKRGDFRADLFYRLHVIPVCIPPLREHKEDIPLLVRHFLDIHGPKMGNPGLEMAPGALVKLLQYDWPGNTRELSNVIERAMCLCDGTRIEDEDIILVAQPSQHAFKSEEAPLVSLKDAVEATERNLIKAALKKHRTVRQAAKALEVTHTLLLNRMKKNGIQRSAFT